jgi:MFS family permease
MTQQTSTDTAAGEVPRGEGGWTPRLVFSFLTMAAIVELVTINFSMIGTALPVIAAHFQTTQGAWLISAFLLAGAVLCPLFGKLADLYGKRRLLIIALAGGAIGAVLSAVAPTYGALIAGRVLQGMLLPSIFLTYSLMRDVYPPRILAMAASVSIAGVGLVYIPSPFLTGWLIDTWGFRSVFAFYIICSLALLVAVLITTDESPVRAASRLDILGALLLGGGLAGVLVGVSVGPAWGWATVETLAFLVVGCVLLAAWWLHALRTRDPLIDLRIFRRRAVSFTALPRVWPAGRPGCSRCCCRRWSWPPSRSALGMASVSMPWGSRCSKRRSASAPSSPDTSSDGSCGGSTQRGPWQPARACCSSPPSLPRSCTTRRCRWSSGPSFRGWASV